VLDGYDEAEMCSGGRGQILAPWPNRLGGGRYEWAGRAYQAALSEAAHDNAIHGLVRWANWSVTAAADGTRARTEHRLHPQPGWGWSLDLAADYELGDDGLTVTTTATNASPDEAGACAIGIGWHPYLAAFGGLVDDLTLIAPAGTAYTSDDRGLPIGRYDTHGTPEDFFQGKKVGAAVLDTAFTDLPRDCEGRAWVTVRAGNHETRLWMDRAYTHLMIFSGDTLSESRRRRGLAVEPMTCAPDAFRSGDGLRTLEPGQSLTAVWGVAMS